MYMPVSYTSEQRVEKHDINNNKYIRYADNALPYKLYLNL